MKSNTSIIRKIQRTSLAGFFLAASSSLLTGAGLLESATGSKAIELVDQDVHVEIRESYARTEVKQTFRNLSQQDLEAIYSFPLPKGATLSEFRIIRDESVESGEVVERKRGEALYDKHSARGESAGLATQEGYQRFKFNIYPVPAASETVMEIVYYETLEVDTGIGVYRYPLEEGGTDDNQASFWGPKDELEGTLTIEVEVSSAWPVADLRVPGFAGSVAARENGWKYRFQESQRRLNKDFVLYYRFADNLPGRIDVLAYKEDAGKPGTFMAIVTPGMDLQPLAATDTVFILDISGSMQSKYGMLAAGVQGALQKLRAEDRFRVVLFNDNSTELTSGWTPATQENVEDMQRKVKGISVGGGTNIYSGLKRGLGNLDSERTTNVVFITDGVANVGELNPRVMANFISKADIRLFAFVMGNGANWPLMETLCETTGGYARSVSNSQDIIGEILLAQQKTVYEALDGAAFTFGGNCNGFDFTGTNPGKFFRGEQVVVFGRYLNGGRMAIELEGTISGSPKSYSVSVDLPEADASNPELERLWALSRMKELADEDGAESKDAALDLALEYQFVTEQTAMVVLDDASFAEEGIERRNLARTNMEKTAQATRQTIPVDNAAVATHQQYKGNSPSIMGGGGSGGALGWELLLLIPLAFVPALWELAKPNKSKA